MSTVLARVIELAASPTSKVSDALRQAMIVATRLRLEVFAQWLNRELNGYPLDSELPEYRVIRGEPIGDFIGPFQSGYRNLPIAPASFPEQHRFNLTHMRLYAGISEYEALAGHRGGNLRYGINRDYVMAFSDKVVVGYTLVDMWIPISAAALLSLTDQVRNRLLELTLELETIDPQLGNVAGEPTAIEMYRAQMIVNNFYGTSIGATIGTGNVAHIRFDIKTGDVDSLERFLCDNNIAPDDISKLRRALKEDGLRQDSNPGPAVSSWLDRMKGLAVTGVVGVPFEVLAGAILKFLGG